MSHQMSPPSWRSVYSAETRMVGWLETCELSGTLVDYEHFSYLHEHMFFPSPVQSFLCIAFCLLDASKLGQAAGIGWCLSFYLVGPSMTTLPLYIPVFLTLFISPLLLRMNRNSQMSSYSIVSSGVLLRDGPSEAFRAAIDSACCGSRAAMSLPGGLYMIWMEINSSRIISRRGGRGGTLVARKVSSEFFDRYGLYMFIYYVIQFGAL